MLTTNHNLNNLPAETLLENIIDQIKEVQIKLGYVRESVRLYYPVSSLTAMLDIEPDTAERLTEKLNMQFQAFRNTFGDIRFFLRGERIEAVIPPQGAEYIHSQIPDPPFLVGLIELFRKNPHCSLNEICAVFETYCPAYKCEKMDPGMDFDYVLYFEKDGIDPYYYCMKEEMGHTIYHRFTKMDFEQLVENDGEQ